MMLRELVYSSSGASKYSACCRLVTWLEEYSIMKTEFLKDLVTATNMVKENMKRGEREFAVKALPRRQS